jgi:hypothetical protein
LFLTLKDDVAFIQLSLLHTLNARYPSLTHLSIMGDIDEVDAISSIVCGSNQLRELSVGYLSSEALYYLAVLPTLERLTLDYITEDLSLPQSSAMRFFPCLREFRVTCGSSVSFVVGLVEAMHSSPLASIYVTSDFGRSGCQDLINALGGCCRSSVESINIQGSGIDTYSASPVDVKSLFVFSNLTRFILYSNTPLELNDASLVDMAQAWPHITSLTLRAVEVPSCHVTLYGLIPLARHCLKLRQLSVALDASSAPPPKVEYIGVRHEALRNLMMWGSSIREPIQVATFFHNVFPNVSLDGYSYGPSKDMWGQVTSALRTWRGN